MTSTGPGWIDAILVDWAPGSLQDPVTDEDLLAKWVDCAANGQVAAPAAIATGWLAAGMDQPMGSLLHSLRRAILARSGNAGG